MLQDLKKDLRKFADPKKVPDYQRFFKTSPGEYGEGDIFLGIKVPNSRKVAKKYIKLPLEKIQALLKSKFHEERFVGLVILVLKYKKGEEDEKQKIYDFYLKNTKYINNWDLVDVSCHKVIGLHLVERDRSIIYKLAKSKDLWEKRISVISTFAFINIGQFEDTLKISEILVKDDHDLIHKAVGWALREVGKKDQKMEEGFLKKHYKTMPRTMLRYAIEKFPEDLRQKYLKGEL
ncbi:DNA alkylation repair protein [Patescibacteria group bacterium]